MKNESMKKLAGFTVLFTLVLFSCRPPASKQEKKSYFDLTGFFNEQVRQLNNDSLIVIKTSVLNSQSDVHQVNWTDWKKEFTLFFDSDINKGALTGKYRVDSMRIDSGTTKTVYAALDSALRTKIMEITYTDGRVEEVHIINRTKNFLTTTSEELYYFPMKTYVIKSSVQNRFFGVNEFSVLGKITARERQYF